MPAPRTPLTLSRLPNTPIVAERGIKKDQVRAWLADAMAMYKDLDIPGLSLSSRLDIAYNSLLVSSLALLGAEGYRVTSKAGHHALALEGAASILGFGEAAYERLDTIREWRNNKYEGVLTTEGQAKAAIKAATEFLQHVSDWLDRRPELLRG